MSRPALLRAGKRRPALVASLATLAVTAALTTAPGGSAVSAPLDTCPEAYPVDDVAPDQDVTGLTVSQGQDPEEFSGKVLGVIDDGIAPDVDMIMVRLTSDEIDRVGGIWAGMSGSPVYSSDDRLIGAVAYGLTWGSSPVAGVTPAADMQALLDQGAGRRAMAERVALPRRTAARLVHDGTVSAKQADSGLNLLATPLAVSGMSTAKRLNKATKRLGLQNVKVYRSGSAPTARVAPEDAGIVPGGNLAASLAYGDFSAVGTGTVTMVCGEDVVGFGHPFDWVGATSMGLHNADALFIQEDTTGAPFKVSNPTGPVGTIDQDRGVGIAGFVGDLPDSTEVTSTIEAEGRHRTGTTVVPMQDYLPDLSALGVVANAGRVLDAVTDGTAGYSFTINGDAGGTPFSLTRENVMADNWDIAYMSPYELYSVVSRLQNNRFTDVHIDDIDFDGTLSPDFVRYQISSIEVKQGTSWVKVGRRDRVRVAPGGTLKLRVVLGSFRNKLPEKQVRLDVPVTWSNGSAGDVFVTGGTGEDAFFKSASATGVSTRRASSFQGLVDDIESAPRNDQVTASLEQWNGAPGKGPSSVSSTPQDTVVTGFKLFRLVVRR